MGPAVQSVGWARSSEFKLSVCRFRFSFWHSTEPPGKRRIKRQTGSLNSERKAPETTVTREQRNEAKKEFVFTSRDGKERR